MDEPNTIPKEKITLPENTQREMMKFFLKTSIPKIAADKKRQTNPPSPKMEADWVD